MLGVDVFLYHREVIVSNNATPSNPEQTPSLGCSGFTRCLLGVQTSERVNKPTGKRTLEWPKSVGHADEFLLA